MAVIFIIFISTFIGSAFGFGDALIAVPLLSMIMPVSLAVPLAALVSIILSSTVVLQDRSQINYASVKKLMLSSLIGIPIGVFGLVFINGYIVKAILGVCIMLFACYFLFSTGKVRLANGRGTMFFGFLAGALGGAYSMNGPPLVAYGALSGWSPKRFRATLQGYFLPSGILIILGYWGADILTEKAFYYTALSLPFVILATVMGRWVNGRIEGEAFIKYIYMGLFVLGLLLLTQTLYGM